MARKLNHWKHGSVTWGSTPLWVVEMAEGWWCELRGDSSKHVTKANTGPWPTQKEVERALLDFLHAVADDRLV